ncbi:unnamed protein product [Ectocarpus sp. 6 AP-2014]
MARKSKSGRSGTSDTRSNASGRSRRSSRSRTSRASTSRRPVQPMELVSTGGGGAGGGEGGDMPSQKWHSAVCCAGGIKSLYGLCVPCGLATARHRLDGSSWCVNAMCLSPCAARNIVRHGYGIKGHCCADIMCSLVCAPCVTCQLMGETEKRGCVYDSWNDQSARSRREQPWKFGLFNCLDDWTTCSYGFFCPMPAVGTIRTQMDDSDWIFNCLCINPFIARSLVRQSYNIEGTDSADCLLTCCCFPCSITQMLNETQHRGNVTGSPGFNAVER